MFDLKFSFMSFNLFLSLNSPLCQAIYSPLFDRFLPRFHEASFVSSSKKNLSLLNQTFKLLNECMTFFFMNNCLTQNQLLDARLPFDNRPHPSLSHNVRYNCSKSKIPASASISITDFFGKIMKKSGDPFRAP